MEDYYNCSMLKLLTILCIGILCQAHVYLDLGQFVASGPLSSQSHTHGYPLLKRSNLNYVHSIISPHSPQRKCGCNHCAGGHRHHEQQSSSANGIKIQHHDAYTIQKNQGQGCQCGHSHPSQTNGGKVCERCNNKGCICDQCNCGDKKTDDGAKVCSKGSSCKCGSCQQCKNQGGCTCSKQKQGSKNLGKQGGNVAGVVYLPLNPLQKILTSGSASYV